MKFFVINKPLAKVDLTDDEYFNSLIIYKKREATPPYDWGILNVDDDGITHNISFFRLKSEAIKFAQAYCYWYNSQNSQQNQQTHPLGLSHVKFSECEPGTEVGVVFRQDATKLGSAIGVKSNRNTIYISDKTSGLSELVLSNTDFDVFIVDQDQEER